jgi:hypothetical protein
MKYPFILARHSASIFPEKARMRRGMGVTKIIGFALSENLRCLGGNNRQKTSAGEINHSENIT